MQCNALYSVHCLLLHQNKEKKEKNADACFKPWIRLPLTGDSRVTYRHRWLMASGTAAPCWAAPCWAAEAVLPCGSPAVRPVCLWCAQDLLDAIALISAGGNDFLALIKRFPFTFWAQDKGPVKALEIANATVTTIQVSTRAPLC